MHAPQVVVVLLRLLGPLHPASSLKSTRPCIIKQFCSPLPTLTPPPYTTTPTTRITAMSSSTTSSSHYYVALPADSTSSTASASTTAAAGYPQSSSPPPRVVRTKRRCLGLSSGCLLLLLLGLLLFFLVPRRPIVRYQSSTLSLDEGTSSVTLTQLFSYYNPNYYTVYVCPSSFFSLAPLSNPQSWLYSLHVSLLVRD